MGRWLVFDIETKMKHKELRKDQHILEQVDNAILSLCIMDVNTRQRWSCTDYMISTDYITVPEGLKLLAEADKIIGHNICGFDYQAIKQIYPHFTTKADLLDTMLMSQLIYPDLITRDYKRKDFPKALMGRHSLKAWGQRLTNFKTDYQGDFLEWSKEMQDYCEQDVEVTASLFAHLHAKHYSEDAIIMEGKFKQIITQQTLNGVHFDSGKAEKLYEDIKAEIIPLENEIIARVPPLVKRTEFTPKRDNKTRGYKKGETIIKETVTPFNPNSRQQIVKFLQDRYSWKPQVFTDSGAPQINHEVMDSLSYPEAPLFSEFLVRKALMSKIKDAKGSWLNSVRNGKIHGKMNTIGTRTRRASHNSPNLGQVPAPGKYKGEECRELFYAPKGWKIVGCDQAAIQLRVLAHYLSPYDNGRYAEIVLNGDIHTSNQKAAGLPTRPLAKRFIYAFLFGGGAALLGSIVHPKSSEQVKSSTGKKLIVDFLAKTPGFKNLLSDVSLAHNSRSSMKLIDGGTVPSPSKHTALNSLLQGTDAVICKTWNVITWRLLEERNLDHCCKQILQIHDEIQMLVKEEYAKEVSEVLEEAAILAGIETGFRLPTAGNSAIGNNWLETH